jgi:hypothetical protein
MSIILDQCRTIWVSVIITICVPDYSALKGELRTLILRIFCPHVTFPANITVITLMPGTFCVSI